MSEKPLTKKERQAARKIEKTEQQQQALRKKRQHLMKIWFAGIVTIGLVIVLTWYAVQQSAQGTPGEQMADQGREHVPAGEEHEAYNSMPPTSGPHATAARWGKHDDAVPYENQAHNLEHGGIIIHYQPDRIANFDELEALFDDLYDKYPKMMLLPNTDIETTYAVTGWNWLDAFDDYDTERIRLFTKKRYNKAPEPNAS